jgi:hypothetical protein
MNPFAVINHPDRLGPSFRQTPAAPAPGIAIVLAHGRRAKQPIVGTIPTWGMLLRVIGLPDCFPTATLPGGPNGAPAAVCQ